MSADPRPSSDAVIATVADQAAVDAVLSDIGSQTTIGTADIAHGTGEEFALRLEGSDDETSAPTRLGKWLLSLGQEREELIELGQAARDGEYALVINGVDDDETKDKVIEIVKRHGGARITHIGDWQSEDVL